MTLVCSAHGIKIIIVQVNLSTRIFNRSYVLFISLVRDCLVRDSFISNLSEVLISNQVGSVGNCSKQATMVFQP